MGAYDLQHKKKYSKVAVERGRTGGGMLGDVPCVVCAFCLSQSCAMNPHFTAIFFT